MLQNCPAKSGLCSWEIPVTLLSHWKHNSQPYVQFQSCDCQSLLGQPWPHCNKALVHAQCLLGEHVNAGSNLICARIFKRMQLDELDWLSMNSQRPWNFHSQGKFAFLLVPQLCRGFLCCHVPGCLCVAHGTIDQFATQRCWWDQTQKVVYFSKLC